MRKQETAGFFQWIDDSQRCRLNGKSPQVMSVKKLNEQVSNRWTVAAVCGGYESAILRFHPDCSFCSVYTVFSFRTCHLASRKGEWLHYAMRCCLGAAWQCITHDKAETQAIKSNAPKHWWLFSFCAMQPMHLCAEAVRHAVRVWELAIHCLSPATSAFIQ